MAPSIPVAEAYLVALCAESIVYGIHGVTFVACIRIWFRRSKRSLSESTTWPWLVVAISLLVLGTLHLALTCYDIIWAFILYKGSSGPDEIFEILSNWTSVTRVSCDVIFAFMRCQAPSDSSYAHISSSQFLMQRW